MRTVLPLLLLSLLLAVSACGRKGDLKRPAADAHAAPLSMR